MSDAELLSQAARELSMTFIGVASAIRSSVTSLVATKPRELALVVEALVACCKAADHAHAQADHMKREGPLALK
jgi:hypothetical protein